MTQRRRSPRHLLAIVVCAASAAWTLGAQPTAPLATTRGQLLNNPVFYHSRTVSILDTPTLVDGLWRLAGAPGKSLAIAFSTPPTSQTLAEITGTFVDVGRFSPEDSRVLSYNLRPILDALAPPSTGGGDARAWPPRETLFVLARASVRPAPAIAPAQTGAETSLRLLAMAPDAFDGKPITIRGRFRGHNLMGDLPSWPRQTPYDFVLQSGDGAAWVTGIRPRGKNFDLDPAARRDTARWLTVSGTATVIDGQPFVRAKSVALAEPDNDDLRGADVKPAAPAPPPPPTLSFSIPAADETAVSPTTIVRLQFSRDMAGDSFEHHVTITAVRDGAPVTVPTPAFVYKRGNNTLEVTFGGPLPTFAAVTIAFSEGITAADGTALAPAKLTFTTGG